MDDLISKVPIQMNKQFSRVIGDETIVKRAEGYVFQFFTPEKQHVRDLTLEVTNYRLRMYSKADDSIYFEVMLDDIDEPKAETRRVYLISSMIYKIKVGVPRLSFFFEIKRVDRDELSREFGLLQEAHRSRSSLQGSSIVRGAVGFLGSKLEEQRREFNQAKVSSEAGTDSIELLFQNFEELRNVFQKFNSMDKDQEQDSELRKMMQSLGDSNLVSKSSKNYLGDLAGEIERTLGSFLERNHGIASTIEAFALYNSLRGVGLVTPDEFVSACELLKESQAKVVLEKMPDGVLILRLRDMSDQNYFDEKLSPLFDSSDGHLTQESLGLQLKISISLARIVLDMYLRLGVLCLDDHIEGRFYYLNEIKRVEI